MTSSILPILNGHLLKQFLFFKSLSLWRKEEKNAQARTKKQTSCFSQIPFQYNIRFAPKHLYATGLQSMTNLCRLKSQMVNGQFHSHWEIMHFIHNVRIKTINIVTSGLEVIELFSCSTQLSMKF